MTCECIDVMQAGCIKSNCKRDLWRRTNVTDCQVEKVISLTFGNCQVVNKKHIAVCLKCRSKITDREANINMFNHSLGHNDINVTQTSDLRPSGCYKEKLHCLLACDHVKSSLTTERICEQFEVICVMSTTLKINWTILLVTMLPTQGKHLLSISTWNKKMKDITKIDPEL